MKKLFTTRNVISAILVCAILAAGVGVLIFDPFSQAAETEQESELDRIPIDRPYIQHTLPPDRLPVEPDDYPYFIPEVPSVQLSHIGWNEFYPLFNSIPYTFANYVGWESIEYFRKYWWESDKRYDKMKMVTFINYFNISQEIFHELNIAWRQHLYDNDFPFNDDSLFNTDIIFSGDSELIRNYYRDPYWITAQQLREQGFTDECWVPIETFDIILEQVAQEQAVAREQLATQAQEIIAARR